ncbi:MAG: hypothetical protein KDC90_20010 [Ignavibacteriae bacterium]|nr:hypothetical protein [Ignavibacteriota bacterium]
MSKLKSEIKETYKEHYKSEHVDLAFEFIESFKGKSVSEINEILMITKNVSGKLSKLI